MEWEELDHRRQMRELRAVQQQLMRELRERHESHMATEVELRWKGERGKGERDGVRERAASV